MYEFRNNLAKLFKTRLLDEKWLLAPSRRIGLQWVESVARAGQSALNVRVKTLQSMARELVSGRLPNNEARVLSRRAAEIFVLGLLRRASDQLVYFRSSHVESLSKAITQTLHALRLSGVVGADLREDQFESPAKFADVRLMLTMYELELGNRDLLDEASLLQAATSILRDREVEDAAIVTPASSATTQRQFDFDGATTADGSGASKQAAVLLIPDGVVQHQLERELIDAWPKESRVDLRLIESGPTANETVHSDQQLLRFISSPLDAPAPKHDGTVRLVSTIGERNEIRQIFRHVAQHRIPLDDVEILHTSAPAFVPLILELAESLVLKPDESEDADSSGAVSQAGELTTFAEGFPCSMFRPGLALCMWLNWIEDDFRQSTLLQMLRSGLIRVPPDPDGPKTERVSTAAVVRALQSISIGFGHGRYLPAIEQFEQTLNNKLIKANEEEADDLERQRESINRRIAACQALRRLVSGLLKCACVAPNPEETSATKLLVGAITFLRQFATASNANDGKAAGQLRHSIDEAMFWIEHAKLDDEFDAGAWLRSLPATARVGGSGPQPGRIHVDHVFRGGHSGRSHTYIVGLNDTRFRAGGIQDPVLLDAERARLSPHLATASARQQQLVQDFADLMGRLRGNVTLSFSRQSLTSDQETFPSSVLLSAFRLLTGKADADHSDFRNWLDEQSPSAALSPTNADEAVDESDWMSWRLCQPVDSDGGHALLGARFPDLAAGRLAATQRAQPVFTEYDGRVPDAAAELSPAVSAEGDLSDEAENRTPPVMSASRLQMLGRCPLAYFFKQGLGLTLPPDTAVDPHRWLDPLTLGSLLHGLFEDFLRGLAADGLVPDADRDRPLLHELLSEHIAAMKAVMPPPSENVFRREQQRLGEIAETFLVEEAAYCNANHCRPEFFEASLGMAPDEGSQPTLLDSGDPVELTLPSGRRIRMRGRIDRIDRFETSGSIQTFAIWDYKTGSSKHYSQHDPFKQGRVLQPYLYVSMVAHRMASTELRSKLNVAEAQVTHFGFFFPGIQAAGQRVEWPTAELLQGGELIDHLCDITEAGEFPATNDHNDCGICDYQSICGDTKLVALQSAQTLEHDTAALESMRTLRTNRTSRLI